MLTNLLIKSVLYRFYSLGIAFLFFWFVTGEITAATGYTVILEMIKVLQYYLFEVVWRKYSRTADTAG